MGANTRATASPSAPEPGLSARKSGSRGVSEVIFLIRERRTRIDPYRPRTHSCTNRSNYFATRDSAVRRRRGGSTPSCNHFHRSGELQIAQSAASHGNPQPISRITFLHTSSGAPEIRPTCSIFFHAPALIIGRTTRNRSDDVALLRRIGHQLAQGPPAAETPRRYGYFSRYRARIRAAIHAESDLGRTELALAMSQFLQPVITRARPLAKA